MGTQVIEHMAAWAAFTTACEARPNHEVTLRQGIRVVERQAGQSSGAARPREAPTMIYYTWFAGHGRTILADDLDAKDPFGLAPGEIVDAVVKGGHTPAVERPQSEPFRTIGTVTEVEREGLVYLVSVSRDAEEIGVQERRDEAYEALE